MDVFCWLQWVLLHCNWASQLTAGYSNIVDYLYFTFSKNELITVSSIQHSDTHIYLNDSMPKNVWLCVWEITYTLPVIRCYLHNCVILITTHIIIQEAWAINIPHTKRLCTILIRWHRGMWERLGEFQVCVCARWEGYIFLRTSMAIKEGFSSVCLHVCGCVHVVCFVFTRCSSTLYTWRVCCIWMISVFWYMFCLLSCKAILMTSYAMYTRKGKRLCSDRLIFDHMCIW